MRGKASRLEIKWWDRKLVTRSLLTGAIFFIVFWGLAKRMEPPKGYVFERLPVISGIYKCCDAGGRYSKSWIGSVQVNCIGFSYYQLGTGRNDCGLKNELNGLIVDAVQVIVPTIWGASPLISKISSGSIVHYEISDQRMRDLWISGSHSNGLLIAFIFVAVLHGMQMIFIDRKIQNFKGNKK